MSDELKSGEEPAKGLRRIARQEVHRALRRLAKKGKFDEGAAIHEARKELKKLRAALRLARPAMGRRRRREENEKFQEAGAALAPMRDADVLVKTLEQLRCHCQGKAARTAYSRLRAVLLRRRRGVFKNAKSRFRETEKALLAAPRRIKDWPLKKFRWQELCQGIQRTYKQGAKAFRQTELKGLPADMHEWRKRAKDLWQQVCMVRPAQPEKFGALAAEIKRLGQYLGDAHDLVVLAAATAKAKLEPEELELIARLIQVRRLKLQRAAIELGRKLFLQKPRAFARQFKKSGKDWQR